MASNEQDAVREEHRANAARYLRGNADLQAALGIAPGTQLEPRFLGRGEHNENYWFEDPATGRRFVLRVNIIPQPFHDNQVAYEFGALQALAKSGRAPLPLYLDCTCELGKGVIVESFCQGEELNFDALRPGDLLCAAKLMADLHAVPVTEDTPLFRPKDPLQQLFRECLDRFAFYKASAYEDPRITSWAERFIAAAQRLMDAPCAPQDCQHIINTETLPSHFLIPQASAQMAAEGAPLANLEPGFFVDWERPVIGEVAQDVAYFVSPTTTFWDSDYLFPASQVESFLDSYWNAVDGRFPRGNFEARFRAFRAMTALRSTTWCCKALVQYNAQGAYKTQRTVEKLPVYLSDEFMSMLDKTVFFAR